MSPLGQDGESAPVSPDFGNARAALAAAGRRIEQLLRSAGDGRVQASRSEWTIGEVGAHMAVALRVFTQATRGQYHLIEPYIPETDRFPDRLAAVTAATLAMEPERDPAALAQLVSAEVQGFLSATAHLGGSEPVLTPWYGKGVSLSMATATGMLLGEQLLHGYDIAKALKAPWPIDPDQARLVIAAVTSMMPLMGDPDRATDVKALYDLRVRGGPRFVVRVDKGAVSVQRPISERVDCHISADPVALALVAYGRINQWGPIAKGRLLAWGRRPHLALRFKSLFFNP